MSATVEAGRKIPHTRLVRAAVSHLVAPPLDHRGEVDRKNGPLGGRVFVDSLAQLVLGLRPKQAGFEKARTA